MKKALFLFLLVYSYCLYSQADYYWYKGEKIYLEKIDTKKFIVFDALDDSVSLNLVLNIKNLRINKFEKINNISSNLNKYKPKVTEEFLWATIESDDFVGINRANIIYDAPFFLTRNNVEVGLSNLLYVKLNDSGDTVVPSFGICTPEG